jgi:hypothetical protein
LGLLLKHFSQLDDAREPWRVVYPLGEVLLLVTCATIASCDCGGGPAASAAEGSQGHGGRLRMRWHGWRAGPDSAPGVRDTLGGKWAAITLCGIIAPP